MIRPGIEEGPLRNIAEINISELFCGRLTAFRYVFDTIKVNSVFETAMETSAITLVQRDLLYDFAELTCVDTSQSFEFSGNYLYRQL